MCAETAGSERHVKFSDDAAPVPKAGRELSADTAMTRTGHTLPDVECSAGDDQPQGSDRAAASVAPGMMNSHTILTRMTRAGQVVCRCHVLQAIAANVDSKTHSRWRPIRIRHLLLVTRRAHTFKLLRNPKFMRRRVWVVAKIASHLTLQRDRQLWLDRHGSACRRHGELKHTSYAL